MTLYSDKSDSNLFVTREGNNRRTIQNVRVDESGNTNGKAQKCILLFKCLNELVPPYLSDYFIRNRTIHTYKTRQSNDIHQPNPKGSTFFIGGGGGVGGPGYFRIFLPKNSWPTHFLEWINV